MPNMESHKRDYIITTHLLEQAPWSKACQQRSCACMHAYAGHPPLTAGQHPDTHDVPAPSSATATTAHQVQRSIVASCPGPKAST